MTVGEAGRAPKVVIVLVNWNGRNDTLACIESVRNIDYPNANVVIVDNGSSDDSVKAFRAQCPDVALLETGENLGFAGGNNVGIRYALEEGADYLLLLNNDTIVDPQILNSFMRARAWIGQDAILGGKIYYHSEPDRIWYAGAQWNNECSHFDHVGLGRIDDGQTFNALSETDYACGCALFISAEVLNRIGLLDEEFFLTFEETDLCYRAREAGYKSYFVPEAKVWHKISTSFGGAGSALYDYFLMRNRLLWARKNLSLPERLVLHRRVFYELLRHFLPPRIHVTRSGREPLMTAVRRSSSEYMRTCIKRYAKTKAKLMAVRDYLLHRRGDCPASVRTLSNNSRP